MDTNDLKLKLVEEISNYDEILGIGQIGDVRKCKNFMKNERNYQFCE